MSPSDVKYPNVTTRLVGADGNAFNLIGIVSKEMRRAGVSADEIKVFVDQCFECSSYEDLLALLQKNVNVI